MQTRASGLVPARTGRDFITAGLFAVMLLVLMIATLPAGVVQAAVSSRGGVAIVGPDSKHQSFGERLDALHVGWYYDYSYRLDDEARNGHKVALVRGGETNRTPLNLVADQASRYPGHYWMIFNEPDLEGQDKVSDQFLAGRGQDRFAYYAQTYHDYETTIKKADPTAKLVAPNLFFYGDPSTKSWTESFMAAYRSLYGKDPTVDVWGMHVYYLDSTWTTLPQVSLAYSQRLFPTYRDYVHSLPGHKDTPIWVTEMGSIWTYSDIDLDAKSGKYIGTKSAMNVVAGYMGRLIPWLESEGASRWFAFGSNPWADPWSLIPNASYAMDERGNLTQMGTVIADSSATGR